MSLATKKELRAIGNALLMSMGSMKLHVDDNTFIIKTRETDLHFIWGTNKCPFWDRYKVLAESNTNYGTSLLGYLPIFLGYKIKRKLVVMMKEKEREATIVKRNKYIAPALRAVGLGGEIDELKK